MTSHCSLIFVSLTTMEVEIFFIYLLVICISSLMNCPYISFANYIELFFLLKNYLWMSSFLLILLILYTSDTLQILH